MKSLQSPSMSCWNSWITGANADDEGEPSEIGPVGLAGAADCDVSTTCETSLGPCNRCRLCASLLLSLSLSLSRGDSGRSLLFLPFRLLCFPERRKKGSSKNREVNAVKRDCFIEMVKLLIRGLEVTWPVQLCRARKRCDKSKRDEG